MYDKLWIPPTNTLVVQGGVRGSILTPGGRGVSPGQPSSPGPGGGHGKGKGKSGSGGGGGSSQVDFDTIGLAALSKGVSVAPDAAANTKGLFVEISSSTPIKATEFIVVITAEASGDALVDIATGGAGSETVIVNNLLFSIGAGVTLSAAYPIPIGITKNTRVTARCQSSTAVAVMVSILLVNGANRYSRCTTYGANLADSGGIDVDPGGVANTKGSYAEVSASITNPISSLIIATGCQGTASAADVETLLDIATGAGGSEVVLLANLYRAISTNSDIWLPVVMGPIQASLNAGTRLAARAQATSTNATQRKSDIVIYGFD